MAMDMPGTASRIASPAMVDGTVDGTADGVGAATPPWRLVAERGVARPAGLSWLADRQIAALANIADHGLPGTDHEAWRHTNLREYTRRWSESLEREAPGHVPGGVHSVTSPGSAAAPARAERPGAASGEMTVQLVDGQAERLPARVPDGIELRSLRDLPPALRKRADALLRIRGEGSSPEPLVELNTALLADGLLIATAEGRQDAPTIHLQNRILTTSSLVQSRILVDVAPLSRLTLIIEHDGPAQCLANAVLQIRLGPGSQLDLVRVQALPDDALATETNLIEVADSARLGVTSVDMGARLSRQALTVNLAGRGATAEVQGMFLADGHRHIDNQTSLIHRAPGTVSREAFVGIADDHGHGVFGGRVLVLSGAAGSNAALTNRNLLLASTAEIDTKPELEIYVDDVRCSHGATTGQLDANALFYLQSRGLDLREARQVLTIAFLRQGLARIPDPELRDRLDAQLEARLVRSPATTPQPEARP